MAIVIPYVKQTWTDGSGGGTPVSAARLGVLEEGILDVSQAPAVRVTHNAAQTLTTATLTKLAFNTERFDTAGGAASTQHDTVTNNTRLTCQYAGKYQITAIAEFAGNATGDRYLDIFLNNTTVIGQSRGAAAPGGGAVPTVLTTTAVYDLAVNDFVETRAYQASGGNLNVNSTGNYSPEFMMIRVA